MNRYLWLIRHAKSAGAERGQPDIQRPLNPRGMHDGNLMQNFLARQTYPATWLWCSSAQRAAATAQYVIQGFNIAASHQLAEPRLYGADLETLLDIIRQTPDSEMSVALVAHNPGLTYLCNQLAPDYPLVNLPTFGIMRFSCAGAWHQLSARNTAFDGFSSPKTLVDFR